MSRRENTGHARHRSLDYRRTQYRPGLGVCPCRACGEEAFRRRKSGEDYQRGEHFAGCTYVNREKVFAEKWEEENQPNRWSFGGILQAMMVIRTNNDGFFRGGRVAFWITKRERVIVATMIQWLGTNCGWCFLEECVRACGYRLEPDDRPRPKPKPEPPREAPRHLRRFLHLSP